MKSSDRRSFFVPGLNLFAQKNKQKRDHFCGLFPAKAPSRAKGHSPMKTRFEIMNDVVLFADGDLPAAAESTSLPTSELATESSVELRPLSEVFGKGSVPLADGWKNWRAN